MARGRSESCRAVGEIGHGAELRERHVEIEAAEAPRRDRRRLRARLRRTRLYGRRGRQAGGRIGARGRWLDPRDRRTRRLLMWRGMQSAGEPGHGQQDSHGAARSIPPAGEASKMFGGAPFASAPAEAYTDLDVEGGHGALATLPARWSPSPSPPPPGGASLPPRAFRFPSAAHAGAPASARPRIPARRAARARPWR